MFMLARPNSYAYAYAGMLVANTHESSITLRGGPYCTVFIYLVCYIRDFRLDHVKALDETEHRVGQAIAGYALVDPPGGPNGRS